MLQLQLKNLVALKLSKKITFFLKILLWCCLVHAGALVLLLMMTQSKVSVLINTQSDTASISFVPFLKTAPLPQRVTNLPLKKDVVQKQVVPEKKAKIVPKKKLPDKKYTTLTQSKKNITPLKKKPIIKPPVKKNNSEKKTLPIKSEKKLIVKKVDNIIPPKTSAASTVKKEILKEAASKALQKEVQETVVVGNEERELFVMQDILKKDIIKNWKRPTNIPDNALCQFRVLVHKNGEREIMMEKSSQAMALDISARNFLMSYDFPNQWCEKELSIIF